VTGGRAGRWRLTARRGGAEVASALPALIAGLLVAACGGAAGPEAVATEYGRALYAQDLGAVYRLASEDDRRARDEATARAGEPSGFAREVTQQLASFIVATPVETRIDGDRATVRLKLRLPDANDPAVTALVRDWDERALESLSAAERSAVRRQLDALHRARQLPFLDGEETFRLVREGGRWRLALGWAEGVGVRFRAALDPGLPVEIEFRPAEVRATPGERVRVALVARNLSGQEVRLRAGHRIDPAEQAESLALVHCPLLLPLRLGPGESAELVSEYVLLPDVGWDSPPFEVTYELRSEPDGPPAAPDAGSELREGARPPGSPSPRSWVSLARGSRGPGSHWPPAPGTRPFGERGGAAGP
jgi:hypothetical protein